MEKNCRIKKIAEPMIVLIDELAREHAVTMVKCGGTSVPFHKFRHTKSETRLGFTISTMRYTTVEYGRKTGSFEIGLRMQAPFGNAEVVVLRRDPEERAWAVTKDTLRTPADLSPKARALFRQLNNTAHDVSSRSAEQSVRRIFEFFAELPSTHGDRG